MVGGIISKIKRILTKNGEPMLFVDLEDLSGKTELIVFPSLFSRKSDLFKENKIILAYGKVDEKDGEIKLIGEEIEELLEE